MAASIMNAPAGLVLAKLMVPETEKPRTSGNTSMDVERPDANVIGAAARGASEGMTLVLNVAAMLLAFIALIAMINYLISLLGSTLTSCRAMLYLSLLLLALGAAFYFVSRRERRKKLIIVSALAGSLLVWWLTFLVIHLSFEQTPDIQLNLEIIFGVVMRPLAYLMGVPWKDAAVIGGLLGEKLVLNEFFAYAHLGQILQGGKIVLEARSVTIATYALLGFANFSSIAIQIGGIGGIAPGRRQDLARLGLKAMLAGTLAAYLSACVASILIP
jgi:CNT family concentrative nucleoside transporter